MTDPTLGACSVAPQPPVGAFGGRFLAPSDEHLLSPPYLFRGPRPSITGAAHSGARLGYGQTLTITVDRPGGHQARRAAALRFGHPSALSGIGILLARARGPHDRPRPARCPPAERHIRPPPPEADRAEVPSRAIRPRRRPPRGIRATPRLSRSDRYSPSVSRRLPSCTTTSSARAYAGRAAAQAGAADFRARRHSARVTAQSHHSAGRRQGGSRSARRRISQRFRPRLTRSRRCDHLAARGPE